VCSSDLHLFNSSQIASELSKGLYFNSNIPIGYGVGSSGALVAAFYNEFVTENDGKSIDELRQIFAGLESYFHGNSSGFDPLVSFLDKPLHKSNNVNQVDIDLSPFNAFIIDTDISRSTQNLVNNFKTKAEDSDFENMVIPAIVKSTNGCIKAILNADFEDFFSNLRELSALQFQHLQEFIPVDYRFLWKKGLNTDGFYLKLCGAGGGGYILGFAKKSSGLPEAGNLILL
jgi:mevalonate kinase